MKPVRFFFNDATLPEPTRNRLIGEGKIWLARLKELQETGSATEVWNKKTANGTVFKIDTSGDIDNVIVRGVLVPRKRILKSTKQTNVPAPLIVLNYDTDAMVQVFMACKSPMEKFPYPSTGTEDHETYETFGINYRRDKGRMEYDNIEIRSLKPIKHSDCYLHDDINTGIVYLYNNETIIKQLTEIPLYSYALASAVVKGQEGYVDYETWALIFAQNELPLLERFTPSTFNIKMAFCDPQNGYRQYDIETVSLDYELGEPALESVSAVSVFDYYGVPYFVSSYVGVWASGVA